MTYMSATNQPCAIKEDAKQAAKVAKDVAEDTYDKVKDQMKNMSASQIKDEVVEGFQDIRERIENDPKLKEYQNDIRLSFEALKDKYSPSSRAFQDAKHEVKSKAERFNDVMERVVNDPKHSKYRKDVQDSFEELRRKYGYDSFSGDKVTDQMRNMSASQIKDEVVKGFQDIRERIENDPRLKEYKNDIRMSFEALKDKYSPSSSAFQEAKHEAKSKAERFNDIMERVVNDPKHSKYRKDVQDSFEELRKKYGYDSFSSAKPTPEQLQSFAKGSNYSWGLIGAGLVGAFVLYKAFGSPAATGASGKSERDSKHNFEREANHKPEKDLNNNPQTGEAKGARTNSRSVVEKKAEERSNPPSASTPSKAPAGSNA